MNFQIFAVCLQSMKRAIPIRPISLPLQLLIGLMCLSTIKSQNYKLRFFKILSRNKGLEIYAYVLTPSHLHMMCRVKEGVELVNVIRDFKKFTSKKIIQNIKEEAESSREWLLEMFAKACEHLKRTQQYKV